MKLSSLKSVAIILLVTIGLLELAGLYLFEPKTQKEFSRGGIENDRLDRIEHLKIKQGESFDTDGIYAFHPYVGYTGRPGKRPRGDKGIAFNQYGMLSRQGHQYPYIKKEDDFVIAILGGSVAEIFSNLTEQWMNDYLKSGANIDKNLVFVNLATGGFKQPQQLFHLQYALLSGFVFDGVINIDGFNEIALGRENLDRGINAVYPSGYHFGPMSLMNGASGINKEIVYSWNNYFEFVESELKVLSFIQNSWLRYSVFSNLVGELWTQRFIRKIGNVKKEFTVRAQQEMSDEFKGPSVDKQKNYYEYLTDIWQRSSEMIHRIAANNDMVYIHILQPNQYVEGSKVLSVEENALMKNEDNQWGKFANAGYPNLQRRGAELLKQGIAFYDMSLVFNDVSETLYTDDCCHFNRLGNEILAEKVADALVLELEKHRQ